MTDVHSGTTEAECLGIITHEGTSWRSHAWGAKDSERGASERERELEKEREREREREREEREGGDSVSVSLSLSLLLLSRSLSR